MTPSSTVNKITCDYSYELIARNSGARLVAGVDEVGRGALAGPVVAAAVILDPQNIPIGLNDSKKLSLKTREKLDAEIRASALAFSIARIEADEIDRINILQATIKAMNQAILTLEPKPDFLLIDALNLKEIAIQQKSIIKGDAQSVSIAAASIIAKIARDGWMRNYDLEFCGYGFAKNAGYGTAEHLKSLKILGPSKIHRLTFGRVISVPQSGCLF